MSFYDQLTQRAKEADSLLCVGLDPHPDDLEMPSAGSARDFCLRLIEKTASQVAAFKANMAFFEAYGAEGISALKEVVAAIPMGIPVILDAKRGDIASTSRAYARAIFEGLGAQAVTINPYLGYDSIEPFLADPERGVFLLCKTSNPGAGDLQDTRLDEPYPKGKSTTAYYLFEKVAWLAESWNRHSNLGLVVGATYPEALKQVRRLAPDLWILVPGVGAQGGDLHAALQAGLRLDGMGLLITVSRGVARADEAGEAAKSYRMMINDLRSRMKTTPGQTGSINEIEPLNSGLTALADGLLEAGCVKFGQFKLKSGLISPIYIDLRQLVSFPRLLEQVAKAYLPILKRLSFSRLAGLPYAALPITTAISLQGGWAWIYPRKEVKAYGTQAAVEGVYAAGERVVVIDDLATTGGSKFEAINTLSAAGLIIQDVVVLIDRQSGAVRALAEAGYTLHAVMTISSLLDHYEKNNKVPRENIKEARQFLAKNA